LGYAQYSSKAAFSLLASADVEKSPSEDMNLRWM
jgi:hypothetical protein